MSARDDYLDWRRQAYVGCVFARLIASDPSRFAQKIESVPSGGTATRAAATLARRIDRLVGDNDVAAGVLLLPDVLTLERLTEIALALGGMSKWNVRTSMLQNTPVGDLVAVHLNRQIPFGSAECPSEALVLGPFDVFAPTRRAPVTALEMYVGQPRALDPKTSAPTTKANLAHIELNLPTHAVFEQIWQKSVDGRLRSLGGQEDGRAKAKVSFVVPTAIAQQAGCLP